MQTKMHKWLTQATLVALSMMAMLCTSTRTWAQGCGRQASPETAPNQPQLIVQIGHFAVSAAFSPDGRFVVTGGDDDTARLWEAATGREVRCFAGQQGTVYAVVFSPDGHFIAVGNRFFEIATGREVRRLEGHATSVRALAFSPDGRFVVTAGIDTDQPSDTVRLWDVTTGREIRSFTGHPKEVIAVAFSSDGQFILTGSWDDTARLWEVSSGREIHRFVHSDTVTSVTFSPDGRFILTGSRDDTARLWEVATGNEIRRFEGHTVAFSPDGRLVLTLSGGLSQSSFGFSDSDDMRARLWDLATGQEVRQLQGYAASSLYYGTSDDGRVWTQSAGRRMRNHVTAAAFSPDGRRVLTVNGEVNGKVRLWEGATGQEVWRLEGVSSTVWSVAFSPDGLKLLTANDDGTARLWDLATGQEVRRLQGAGSIGVALFSPDSRFVLTGGEFFAPPRLWDVSTGQEVRRFGDQVGVSPVAFSPDGRLVLTGGSDGVRLWNAMTGEELRQFASGSDVKSLAFSPNSRLVLIASGETPAQLWEVNTGRKVRSFVTKDISGFSDLLDLLSDTPNSSDQNLQIHVSVFSPDGHSVLVAGCPFLCTFGSSIVLLDVNTGQEVRRFINQGGFQAESAAFSANGRFIVTGHSDGTASLWEVASGQEVHRFEHGGRVTSVAFSPDGRFVLTGSEDKTTRLWDPVTGQELCRLISFRDGTWVVVDREGRFDTNNLDNNPGLHWLMPDDPLTPLPLEIFMRDYYEPRLLPRILAGEKFRPVRALQDLNRVQPIVKVTKVESQANAPDTVMVTVEAAKAAREFQRGGKKVRIETGVYDLRLFRDGQLVGYAPESEGEVVLDPQTGTAVRTFIVKLPRTADKKEVEFSAYAFNSDRVKSATDRKTFTLPEELRAVKGRAYLITVGVNAYDNPAWDLQFAANDSRRIERTLRERLADNGDYEDVISIPLISDHERRNGERVVTENRATKRNVQTVLALLAGKTVGSEDIRAIPNADKIPLVRPEDLVLISVSSHGYADATGNFYFFLTDAGEGDGRQITADLLQRALSSEELSRWLRDVDGGEMVLIVDACHAASTVEGEGFKPGPMGSRGLGQLAYDKGMRVLTASQADDVALESDLLQQGLLTYALIHDGLEAYQADDQPRDHLITLSEWLGYGVERVPTLYEEVKTGQIQSFERGERSRGVVVMYTEQDDNSLKKSTALQQPALFDFTKHTRATVLVREQENLKRTESSPKKTESP